MTSRLTPAAPDLPSRRTLLRRWRDAAGAAGLAALAGCAGWSPVPDHVEISEARLLEQLAARFPLRRRVMDLVDLNLVRPRLRLRPERNRLDAGFDVAVLDARWWPRGLQGRLELGFGLRLDPADHSLYLRDVEVQLFEIDGVPPALAPQVRRLGAALAELFLEDLVIWRIDPERLRQAERLGRRPGAVTVTATGVRVALEPIPPR